MRSLRIWNSAFTVFVFLLPLTINYLFRKAGSPYYPEVHLLSMLPFLIVVALLWSAVTNHFFLPGLARGWVYSKNFGLMILQCYLATEATMVFHHLWIGALLNGRGLLAVLGWGLSVHVWLGAVSGPLIVICTFVNGYVLKRLYKSM